MTSGHSVDLAPRATRDMQDIARISGLEWDETQARGYISRIESAFYRIGTYPELGVRRDDISPGLRSIPVGSHMVFYEVYSDYIMVLRVLHQRMDVARAFEEN